MLDNGDKPEQVTDESYQRAMDTVQKAVDSGQIRRFTGNDYGDDLVRGDSEAILGWSGDPAQLAADNPNIKWRHQNEGFMVFTDSMQIPVGAPHAFTAEKYMDFVYDPEIAAEIAAYVNYVPPVKGAKEVLQERDPNIASNQLIFPDLSNAHNFKTFPPDEEAQIDEAFQRAIGT
jgi:spermidine/putrescine transport system substrate-binding protein